MLMVTMLCVCSDGSERLARETYSDGLLLSDLAEVLQEVTVHLGMTFSDVLASLRLAGTWQQICRLEVVGQLLQTPTSVKAVSGTSALASTSSGDSAHSSTSLSLPLPLPGSGPGANDLAVGSGANTPETRRREDGLLADAQMRWQMRQHVHHSSEPGSRIEAEVACEETIARNADASQNWEEAAMPAETGPAAQRTSGQPCVPERGPERRFNRLLTPTGMAPELMARREIGSRLELTPEEIAKLTTTTYSSVSNADLAEAFKYSKCGPAPAALCGLLSCTCALLVTNPVVLLAERTSRGTNVRAVATDDDMMMSNVQVPGACVTACSWLEGTLSMHWVAM
jgi:hypothetical protein